MFPEQPLEPALRKLRASLPRRLLAWFDRKQRHLPWRRDRDPYRIWVSEVMLQQTQVATVVPYFERFLAAFPTLASLAAASERDVLRLWEGLGYYRRAQHLLQAARVLITEHGGQFPNDPAVVRSLPGLGRYTCNAVLSQAFDRRLPILEANSLRVLSRLLGRRDDPRRGSANRELWQAAEEILPARRIGAFNQAVMELGALVCTPKAPRCGACPAAELCTARRAGAQELIPPPQRPTPVRAVRETAVVIYRRGRVLLVQRPATARRWANLWEFPRGPLERGETTVRAALRLAQSLTGLSIRLKGELPIIRHSVTRFAIALTPFEAEWQAGHFHSSFYVSGRWLRLNELSGYPVSAPQRRLAVGVAAKRR